MLGLEREFGSPPTADSERRTAYGGPSRWTPTTLNFAGHTIRIDVPTGNVFIETTDIGYPFHSSFLAVSRGYDLQEQWMQHSYRARNANVDLTPHWFGSWTFAHEASVQQIWHETRSVVEVAALIAANGLFGEDGMVFRRHRGRSNVLAELATHGVPRRTLDAIGWDAMAGDALLRTTRGDFQILAGRMSPESLVDLPEHDVAVFSPPTGMAARIQSSGAYNTWQNGRHERGSSLLVTRVSDALGHKMSLEPLVPAPFEVWSLADDSGRAFRIERGTLIADLDGDLIGGSVGRRVVSRVVDESRAEHNTFDYEYRGSLLSSVTLPSSIGSRIVRYAYGDVAHPDILTRIIGVDGAALTFEYLEDEADLDARMNPRLKIRRLTTPTGARYDFEYESERLETRVTISNEAGVERKVRFRYQRDTRDTNRRYVTQVETTISRGFRLQRDRLVERAPGIAVHQTSYSTDGRFDPVSTRDPSGRTKRYQFDAFGLLSKEWDEYGRMTEYVRDIPEAPSPETPLRYDVLAIRQDALLRQVPDVAGVEPIPQPQPVTLVREMTYARYTAANTEIQSDQVHSTHRLASATDELGKRLRYEYDDDANFRPLRATATITPLGHVSRYTFNRLGLLLSASNAENETQTFEYDAQGLLRRAFDQNQNVTIYDWYPCGLWLRSIADPTGATTRFTRDRNGLLVSLIDAVESEQRFIYDADQRLWRSEQSRPAVAAGPDDAGEPHMTVALELRTEFGFTPLGFLKSITAPSGLRIAYQYDEAGSLISVQHEVDGEGPVRYAVDLSGRVVAATDKMGRITRYRYDVGGQLYEVKYSAWDSPDGLHFDERTNTVVERDHAGRALLLRDSNVPVDQAYAYDRTGRLTWRRDSVDWELRWTFDDDGRLTEARSAPDAYLSALSYDRAGRVVAIRDGAHLDEQSEWIQSYRLERADDVQVGNLYSRRVGDIGLLSAWEYDPRNLPASAITAVGDVPLVSQFVDYAPDGMVWRLRGNSERQYKYDALKQLVFSSDDNRFCDFDANGNVLLRTVPGSGDPPNVIRAPNRLAADATSQYEYDGCGNLKRCVTGGAAQGFQFDPAGQLRVVSLPDKRIEYAYDQIGRLVERSSTGLDGVTTRHALRYGTNRCVSIRQDGEESASLTWSPDGVLLRVRTPGEIGAAPFRRSAFVVNGLYNSTIECFSSTGASLARIVQDAWGEVSRRDDPSGVLRFHGARNAFRDPDTGLCLFGARWYWPAIARWITEDSLIKPETTRARELGNAYAFALNSPVLFADPTGYEAEGMTWSDACSYMVAVGNTMTGAGAVMKTPPADAVDQAVVVIGSAMDLLGYNAFLPTSMFGSLPNVSGWTADIVGEATEIFSFARAPSKLGAVTLTLSTVSLLDTVSDGYFCRGEFGGDLAEATVDERGPFSYRDMIAAESRTRSYQQAPPVYACRNGQCDYLWQAKDRR
jgi:RHS repeat-associated protein